MEEQIDKLV
jgi:hypothetical protein